MTKLLMDREWEITQVGSKLLDQNINHQYDDRYCVSYGSHIL